MLGFVENKTIEISLEKLKPTFSAQTLMDNETLHAFSIL